MGTRYPRRRFPFRADWPGTCDRCAQPIQPGDLVQRDPFGVTIHADCDNPHDHEDGR